MKKVLIDCTLTGGRGPAKKAVEFIWECQRLGIPYKLMTDKRLVAILNDFNIKPDYIVPVDFSSSNEEVYSLFEKTMSQIPYDVLIKFGARTPGPYVARKQGKPYIIIDGGLPDSYSSYPSMYDKDTYEKAAIFIVTSNFPWIPTPPIFIKNVRVAYFPLSGKSMERIEKIKVLSNSEIKRKFGKYFTSFAKNPTLSINLSMTNDYVDSKNRTTYGAWLKTYEYDQCVGFIRRLITDLGSTNKNIEVILDSKIARVATDVLEEFKNITIVTWKSDWDYEAEIALDMLSDITISRAANYQPFIFALSRGNSITSAVPASGYMNEDNAAIQAQALGFTENIPYDDERYIERLMAFFKDKNKQVNMAKNQKQNFESFRKNNNSLTLLLNFINSL